MKLKNNYKLLSIVFILWTVLVAVSLYTYKEYRVQQILESQIYLNNEKYNSAYQYYKLLSKNINQYAINAKDTTEILKQLKNTSPIKLNQTRKELQRHINISYQSLKKIDIRQLHFHLKDNTSFLRTCKPLKFGDNLTDVRYGVKLVNQTLTPVHGFEAGRNMCNFRFIFPIIDREKNHLGSVEFSVRPKGLIEMMKKNSLSDIHFLVKKSIVDSKLWSDELSKHYQNSVENHLYYLEKSTDIHGESHHEYIQNDKELQSKISKKIQQEKAFAIYYNQQTISFLPIENIKGEKIAYFVVYTDNKDIKYIVLVYWILNFINILILISFSYILYKDYLYKVLINTLNKKLSFKIKEEVEKSREQELYNYNILFNSMPSAGWVIDPESGNIIDVNRSTIDRYGYTKDEFLKMSVYDLDPRSNTEIDLLIKKAKDEGRDNFETSHITKDGTKVNVIVSTSKIFLNNKEYFLSIAIDITNRIKIQKEIQYHRDTLQAIVYILNELITNKDFHTAIENSLAKVIKTLNVDRVYIFKNQLIENTLTCSQKFESTKENISVQMNNPKLQNIPYSDADIIRWKEKFTNHEHIEGIVKTFPKAEKEILESQGIKSILVMPIWFEEKFWGFIGFDDCTNERVWGQFEKDVLIALSNTFISALSKEKYSVKLEKQVRYQIKDLREKDKQLLQQSKLAQMGDMVSMIAHQWRQPLNAISATGINLSLLSSMGKLKSDKVQESSQFIQNQCQKMSSTIDTFMNFVKPARESKAFNLFHSVESIMEIMGAQLSNHNIEVNIETTTKKISIVGYEDLLEQVIINLLSNARDAFENLEIAGKFINITIDIKENIPRITIEDNAGGVPQDIRDKIFNPYFTTKEQGKGTGIGLYMSMDIMKKSFDGDLVYRATDKGSCFEIICGGC